MIQVTPLFISSTEIVFILFIVIMIFGADKIPDIAKGMGKGMRSLKNATNDIKGEIKRSADNQGIDTDDFTKDISQEINKAKEEINDIEGAIRRKL
ncbi:MAG TPA: twin-arginine translocase TatA/TatE family subunit [Flavobacteriaceae bacterium]|jgi:sec-independent protein translocase protein TatA|nr:twin-arginine translocase TatA/TatE family subunit [Formosa sp.]HCL07594.1 twin-arginine translocase TatA/TatE family subunit [Flavobacteriaceae bacterium]|tara:strand:+ start:55 stop:342 length:288 start_codon:yes stop_codon:yes gene_type:complete